MVVLEDCFVDFYFHFSPPQERTLAFPTSVFETQLCDLFRSEVLYRIVYENKALFSSVLLSRARSVGEWRGYVEAEQAREKYHAMHVEGYAGLVCWSHSSVFSVPVFFCSNFVIFPERFLAVYA